MRLGLALAAAVLGLAALELALRVAGVMPDFRGARGIRYVLDPELLDRVAGRSTPELNALGYREGELGPKDPARPRLVVLGDDLVFGDNAAISFTVPVVLESALHPYEVWNLGVPGDGPDQSYARLLKDALPHAPDVVLLCLNAADDFDDLVANDLYVENGGGPLVFNPENPVARELPRFRSAILLSRLLTGDGLDAARAHRLAPVIGPHAREPGTQRSAAAAAVAARRMAGVLALFRDRLAAANVPLQVVVLPSRAAAEKPDGPAADETLALELCEQAGLHCMSLLDPLRVLHKNRLFDEDDGRLNGRGYAVAARRIARQMRLDGLVRIDVR